MEEYKLRRGENLDDRIPDMEATVEGYFGPVTGTKEYKGTNLYVVSEPSNPVFEKVIAGAVSYDGKKDKVAVEFHERSISELIETDDVQQSEAAVAAKNEFLLEATGRDAKARRESLKRDVEDDETPDGVE